MVYREISYPEFMEEMELVGASKGYESFSEKGLENLYDYLVANYEYEFNPEVICSGFKEWKNMDEFNLYYSTDFHCLPECLDDFICYTESDGINDSFITTKI